MLRTAIGRLRVVSIIEGLSFLALLGIAMPLKYLFDMPDPVHTLGWMHGMMFVAFVVALGQVAIDHEWSYFRIAEAFVLSVLPFGAFVLERKLSRVAAETAG